MSNRRQLAFLDRSVPRRASQPIESTRQPRRRTRCPVQRPSREELEKKLTPEQFEVVCNAATEPPFHNAYWNHHEPGIYVDVASGEALFSSLDKFRLGHRLAQLHEAARAFEHLGTAGPRARDGAHRSDVDEGRLAPRPRVRRRPEADGAPLLHQLGVAPVHPGGRARSARATGGTRRSSRSRGSPAQRSPTESGQRSPRSRAAVSGDGGDPGKDPRCDLSTRVGYTGGTLAERPVRRRAHRQHRSRRVGGGDVRPDGP